MSHSTQNDTNRNESPPNARTLAAIDTSYNHESEVLPHTGSIRFVPHVEFSSRMALHFEPMERKVNSRSPIKIGRFNEKSTNRTSISFKSKVVSRTHAEIWCEGGNWYIKDTKSSSGTFINHIRLSPPGQESPPTMLADDDSIQFGIDFRGGTKEDYRCVRTKVEINRIFSQGNDVFNKTALKQLKSLTGFKSVPSAAEKSTNPGHDDRASTYIAECCICLFAIAPAQALFVAPCSHTYHFKCIRPHIVQQYPNFLCCLCRKYADLEASVEVESEAWLEYQATGDPRTPSVEGDEPIYQPIHSVLTQDSAPGQDPASQNISTPMESRADTNVAEDNDTVVTAVGQDVKATSRPINVSNRVQELALDSQNTPRNEAGPYLIQGGLH